ncbi:MAG: hypothetical protein IKP04_05475 [Candidatus Methanomethylophilaceae archaeon]|nr:hypothetical protein [Candidatus Methanomethylophilaceae archaeon]
MTTVIMKDKDWLKNEIEKGIDSFLEMEYEYLIGLMKRYIYEQIYISGCSLNSQSPTDDPAELRIVIDIPDPDKCIDTMENISRKSVFMDV